MRFHLYLVCNQKFIIWLDFNFKCRWSRVSLFSAFDVDVSLSFVLRVVIGNRFRMPLSLWLSPAKERMWMWRALQQMCFKLRTEKGARKGNLRHSQISFFAHLISCFLLLIFCSMTKINMQAFRNVLFLPARAPRIVVLIYLVRSFVLRVPFAASLCFAWSVAVFFVQDGCCFLSSAPFFSLMWHATNHFQWILLGTMRSLNV